MPFTLVALSSSCASISMARRLAAVSVVKKRVAGTGGETTARPFSRWRTARLTDEVFAHLIDADRRHHARLHALLLERILQRQGVHDRRQHAHLIGRDAIHAGSAPGLRRETDCRPR